MAGENVAVMVHWILAVIARLAKVFQLPNKKPIHILKGFELCSMRKFKDTFSLLMNQE